MSKTKIGYSMGTITPKDAVELAGYIAENRLSTGTHDELFTRILLLERNQERFLIVQSDILGVDYIFTGKVKELAAKHGIENPNHVFVGATHTHSGPKGPMQEFLGMGRDAASLVWGLYNPKLCEDMLKTIEECILEATKNLNPCHMSYNFAQIEGVGENRTDKSLDCDKTLLAMEFIREDGKKLLLYHYSCHPTVLNGENTLFTADWPYGVSKAVEGSTYEMVMFLNGSAGDISTRFTRNAPTFEEAERIGKLLYDHIEKALKSPQHEDIQSIKSLTFKHKMALKTAGTIEEEEQVLERYKKELNDAINRGETTLRLYESRVEGATLSLDRTKTFAGQKEMELTLQILKLNDLFFVFVPNELFSALSLPIRNELGEKVMFCSYFSATQGYICDKVAYDNETYETMTSPYQRGEGEKLMEKAKEMILSMMDPPLQGIAKALDKFKTRNGRMALFAVGLLAILGGIPLIQYIIGIFMIMFGGMIVTHGTFALLDAKRNQHSR